MFIFFPNKAFLTPHPTPFSAHLPQLSQQWEMSQYLSPAFSFSTAQPSFPSCLLHGCSGLPPTLKSAFVLPFFYLSASIHRFKFNLNEDKPPSTSLWQSLPLSQQSPESVQWFEDPRIGSIRLRTGSWKAGKKRVRVRWRESVHLQGHFLRTGSRPNTSLKMYRANKGLQKPSYQKSGKANKTQGLGKQESKDKISRVKPKTQTGPMREC